MEKKTMYSHCTCTMKWLTEIFNSMDYIDIYILAAFTN